jgi:hypothetical protein
MVISVLSVSWAWDCARHIAHMDGEAQKIIAIKKNETAVGVVR